RVLPQFESTYTELFDGLESELARKGKALFNDVGEQAAFRFLGRAYLETNPEDTKIGKDGPKLISTWVLFNLGPLLRLGLPWFVEEPLLHTFRLPPALIKKNYNKLYEFFESFSGPIIEHAESLGISKEEAVHNILFTICFNTFGGIKILFPNTLKWIGRAGTNLHTQLAAEIRGAIKDHGGKVTMAAMEQMPLMKSVVYESLRIEPPVALQYGKAKRDLTIESHDAIFKVKEGEMLFGYQPFATKDPKVFDRPEEFVPDRFVGAGEKLLKYVTWSNGPETEGPTVGNKQCAGKDFVVLITRLFVVELFRRYDSFDIEVAASPLGAKVTRVLPQFESTYTELFDELESELARKGKALFNDILFPNTLKWIGRAGTNLHTQLAAEIRGAIKDHGGKVTMAAMEQMPLMKSVVYESLRIEPPVALQYGKAKRDLTIESHDAIFKVKEGEMLFGYQPFATKDPKVFDRAEEFVPDRFVGAGEELLKYVTWSNGPETEGPTVGNKQCAGKDFVVLITRLFVVELFRRYDSFDIEVAASPLGAKVTLTSLKRARQIANKIDNPAAVLRLGFRIEPPVALQYGKAKRDLTIESHDAVFKVKEGEMLFGYQPFATKDPKVFDRPEEFVPDRFVGAGEELLKYVTWSNGPETEGPT
ncbi:hypothetical protein M8C21_000008, partial [Ambrosia artemisiifolia]